MRLNELRAIYDDCGAYMATAKYLSDTYGEQVYGNEVRRALVSGLLSPKLRKIGNKKRHRYCFEFPDAESRDRFAGIVSRMGGQKVSIETLEDMHAVLDSVLPER